jgi:hypothetical protein
MVFSAPSHSGSTQAHLPTTTSGNVPVQSRGIDEATSGSEDATIRQGNSKPKEKPLAHFIAGGYVSTE